MKRAVLVAGVSFAALLMAGSTKLQAAGSPESWWGNSRAGVASDLPAQKSLKTRSKASEKAEGKSGRAADKSPPLPSGPLHIIVSIDKQRATLFADGQPVASTAVSTGTPGHPTPMGVFTVIQKDRHHVSNLYDASMPYMQRITWSGSALHQGPLPGYPASHGCVRLTESFAQLLWKTTKMGARVIVTHPDVAPLEFAHARLFAPKPKMVALPQPKMVAVPPTIVPLPVPMMAAEPATTSSVSKVRTADASNATVNATVRAVESVSGDATKAVTTAVVTEPLPSTAVEHPTKQSDKDRVGDTPAAQTSAAVEPAEVKAVAAQPVEAKPDESSSVEAKSDDAKPEEAKPVEASVVATKPVETKPAEVKQVEAKPVEARTLSVAAPAPIIVDERPKTMPATIVQEANGRPISVFVSLKEKKLYVRQGWKPLFDAPVSFEHPEQPIGTHVYTAMSAKAEGGLRWTVVSIPSATRRVAEAKNSDSARKGRREQVVKVAEIAAPMPSPSVALDRIVMPPELVERISEMITPGSSLIVSDNRLSDETGEYTDFIVLTR